LEVAVVAGLGAGTAVNNLTNEGTANTACPKKDDWNLFQGKTPLIFNPNAICGSLFYYACIVWFWTQIIDLSGGNLQPATCNLQLE
jgi:hypothetical protein